MQRSAFAMFGLLIALLFGANAHAEYVPFADWIVNFKAEASRAGISPRVIDDALNGLDVDDSVIALDQKQPENKITLEQYLKNTINARRIKKGRELLSTYAIPLKRISQKYGVQPKYIVALYGIESDYGQHPGNFLVVRSLATLAYEGRRAEFFSKELMSALQIIEAEGIEAEDLTGSWAGAMGGCQFMPSTYQKYAADGDGDGKRDIWKNPLDAFASIANYLHELGWDKHVGVMQPGELGDAGDFKPSEASLETGASADAWAKRGFRFTVIGVDPMNGSDRGWVTAPNGKQTYYAIYLSKDNEAENSPSLVSENFKALLNWNRSRYFATAVGTLADAIGDDR